jgi:LacI family transcriptional regulator
MPPGRWFDPHMETGSHLRDDSTEVSKTRPDKEVAVGRADAVVSEEAPLHTRPTIADVARVAGVGKSTVSKAVNNSGAVSARTRQQIDAAIAQLGYRPDGVARALTTSRTHIIGLLVASIANPFYSEMIQSIHREAARHGYRLVLATTETGSDLTADLLEDLITDRVDGLIFASATLADRPLVERHMARLPIVLAARHLVDVDVDYVTCDNQEAARVAVAHLVERGHRRIAFVSGPLDVMPQRERVDTYQSLMRSAGGQFDPELCIEGDGTQKSGELALDRLWSRPPHRRPTALIGGSDNIAIGVLARAFQLSIAVPDDLAVVGFDNTSICEHLRVPLTTVDVGIEATGAEAVNLLLRRTAEGFVGPAEHRVLRPRLVARESTLGSPGAGMRRRPDELDP